MNRRKETWSINQDTGKTIKIEGMMIWTIIRIGLGSRSVAEVNATFPGAHELCIIRQ